MTETCGLCGKDRDSHDELNHEFNTNGQLIPKAKPSPSNRPQQVRSATVIGAWDLELRQVLVNKGIITNEDLASLRNSQPSPARDREAGQTEGTD
jgi:hypothetical protein